MECFLKIRVLKELNFSDLSGYGLMKRIENFTGRKPSPGSIYPLLKDLKDKGLVDVKRDGRKKVYSITAKGKKTVFKMLKQKEKLILNGVEALRGMHDILSKDDKRLFYDVHTKKDRFFRNMAVWSELKKEMIKISVSDDFHKKEQKIRGFVKDSVKRLKEMEQG